MATYYVRPDGNDANTGLGPATNQAWATFTKALSSTGISSGDIVYVAPGRYTEFVTVDIANPTVLTRIVGDPTAAQFTGVLAGEVLWSALSSAGAKIYSNLLLYTIKNFLSFENIHFESSMQSGQNSSIRCVTSANSRFLKCQFTSVQNAPHPILTATSNTGTALNITLDSCTFFGSDSSSGSVNLTGQNVSDSSVIRDCLFIGFPSTSVITGALQLTYVNNTQFSIGGAAVYQSSGSASFQSSFINNLFINCGFGIYLQTTGIATENYNRFVGGGASRTNFTTNGPNSVVGGSYGIYGTYHLQQGLTFGQMLSSILGSVNTAFGTATGAPVTDIYGVAWTGATPDAGAATYRNLSSVGSYIPTERNASTITIAPASTSQSIELYLGATGLTFSTSGLAAYYVRNREAPTPITLVNAPDPTWVSGGFAEIDSATVPGLYRLDLPNAALNAGADDVTVVVRGASGTNGAVLTIKLSSGGLTAAQTASAVLDAVASIHNNAGSIGASIQDKAGYSLSTPQSFSTTGSVGSVTGNVAGNVTGTVGGVVGNVVGNITGSVATVSSPDNIIDGVWDEQRTGHTAAGSFGEKLQTNALADEMLARDLGSGLNAGTAEERTVRSALRALRNKVNVGSSQMVVKREDDTTDAWTASVTTTAVSSNVSGIDPN